MKQHKFSLAHAIIRCPVEDGHTFVFTFPRLAYSRARLVVFLLIFDDRTRKALGVSASLDNDNDKLAIKVWDNPSYPTDVIKPDLSKGDQNVVIRVERNNSTRFSSYINDEFITTLDVPDGRVSSIEIQGYTRDAGKVVEILMTLTIFDETENDKAKAFASAMRYPDESWFDSGSPGTTNRNNVNPPDAEFMKLSMDVAWPGAIGSVLGRDFIDVKRKYETLMKDWVTARGDNILPDAYDYSVYAHAVAWPRAVREYTSEADMTQIREQHEEMMENMVPP